MGVLKGKEKIPLSDQEDSGAKAIAAIFLTSVDVGGPFRADTRNLHQVLGLACAVS